MRIKKAVFPLAGIGSRMMPITKSISKEMLSIGNKPLLHYAVEEALISGVTDLIFIVRNNENTIRKYLEYVDISFKKKSPQYCAVSKLNSLISKIRKIHYIKQKKPLGLGHAILSAKNIIGDEAFAVLLADDLIISKRPVIAQMINQYKFLDSPIIAISKIDIKNTINYGILDAPLPDPFGITKIKGLIEKPTSSKAPSDLAIVGRYILTPEIFDSLEIAELDYKKELLLTKAIKNLIDNQSLVYGFCYEGTRFDCGNIAGLQLANTVFAINQY